MTGVIDRYAVMGEHLHYNPNFSTDREVDSTSPSPAVQSPGSDIVGNLGYLDIEAHNATNEMIFHTGGNGETTDDADFEFEMGTGERTSPKGSKKPPKDKVIDLNMDGGGCLSNACECCDDAPALKIGIVTFAVLLLVAGATAAGLIFLR